MPECSRGLSDPRYPRQAREKNNADPERGRRDIDDPNLSIRVQQIPCQPLLTGFARPVWLENSKSREKEGKPAISLYWEIISQYVETFSQYKETIL